MWVSLKWLLVSIPVVLLILLGVALYPWWSFDTETLPPNHGQVQTELYLGDGKSQPLIVAFGGSGGGNPWTWDINAEKRQLFLDAGFAMLAVGYFGLEGTPAALDRIAIDGVHRAVEEALKNPRVQDDCVVPMGISRGSVLALLLGTHYEVYRGVVAIVPGSCVFFATTEAMNTAAFSVDGKPFPFVPLSWSALPSFATGEYRIGFEIMMQDEEAVARAAVPVEKVAGPILFVSATHDEVWPSMEMSRTMMERLDAHGFPHPHEHIPLEGGHEEFQHHFDDVVAFLQAHLSCAGQGKTETP